MQFVDAATVNSALDVPSLVEALRKGFKKGCEMPARQRHVWKRSNEPNATLVLMPAWQTDGVLGVKLTTIVPGNVDRGKPSGMPIYIMFDPLTGAPQAVLDGRSITLNRTAATSALASTYLSKPDAECLLMVGTGGLAPYLVRAHCSVRPISEVRIWGRRSEKAQHLANTLGDVEANVVTYTDLQEAAKHADIISCATLSADPLIHGDWINPGTHVDLVGAFTPSMREADDEIVRKARIYVDQKITCLVEAGDLVQPLQAGLISEDDVVGDLFDLVRGNCEGRQNNNEITLFKSVGMALEDLVAAELVTQRLASSN
jgi:ornithine cyclodeaminase